MDSVGFNVTLYAISHITIPPNRIEEYPENPEKLSREITEYAIGSMRLVENPETLEILKKENMKLKEYAKEKDKEIEHLRQVNHELISLLNTALSYLTPSQSKRYLGWYLIRSYVGAKFTEVRPEDITPESKPGEHVIIKPISPPENKTIIVPIYQQNDCERQYKEILQSFDELKDEIERIEQSIIQPSEHVGEKIDEKDSIELIEKSMREEMEVFKETTKAISSMNQRISKLEMDNKIYQKIKILRKNGYQVYPPWWDDVKGYIDFKFSELEKTTYSTVKTYVENYCQGEKMLIRELLSEFIPKIGEFIHNKADGPLKELGELLMNFGREQGKEYKMMSRIAS